MFGTRRLAKRSIVGSKISARRQNGRYVPGVIQSQYAEEGPFSDAVYSVQFEDGVQNLISGKHIIGPGFHPTTVAVLKNGQNVFLTLNGREVNGTVLQHNRDSDEVLINVVLQNGDEAEVTKRLEEVRLLKSRKSARLLDQDTDYSKLADLHLSEAKKRTVSQGIDVPAKHIRHWQYEEEEEDNNNNNHHQEVSDDVEMMDENIAALVLTSLSCSPKSPQFQDLRELPTFHKTHETQLSSSASSSGFHSNQSERSDPSPPSSHLSESAPAAGSGGMLFGPFMPDEGLELEVEGKDEDSENKNHLKTMFQCTWPKCGKISSTCTDIEKHVRNKHLGVKESSTNSDSEHEEEFYYTEIEVNVENVTQGLSDMSTSSPSSPPERLYITDHDYQKKDYRQVYGSSVPSGGYINNLGTATVAISIPQIKRSLSWQNTYTFSSSPSPPIRPSPRPSPQERLQQHQAQSPKNHMLSMIPKTAGSHKKPRSEVRKCRKVYGMENRDMWCTQCKWKKACTRFLD